ncbi:MAG TPA: type II toxin-antitoxin system prevent-host-death family antitoxin [bacterium]|nr:type II toxin-antitoxin system prevent-host-death family antitoxin [bacterium]
MFIGSIHQAKTHLSRLVDDVLDGKEVVIGKAGKPLVKLVVYHANAKPRKPGSWKGKVKISKDFDRLPSALQKSFAGERE